MLRSLNRDRGLVSEVVRCPKYSSGCHGAVVDDRIADAGHAALRVSIQVRVCARVVEDKRGDVVQR